MIYDLILADTCSLCGVTLEDAFSTTRRADAVKARNIAWYVLHKHYGWSLTVIAQNAKKHHTTVLHGIRSIEDAVLLYRDIRGLVDQIRSINYIELIRGIEREL